MKFILKIFFSSVAFLSGMLFYAPFACAQDSTITVISDSLEGPISRKEAKINFMFYDAIKAKVQDDDKKAIELFEAFLKSKPDVSAPYYELAKLYEKDNDIEKAEDNIKKAIKLDGNNKWYKVEYATILAEQSKYAQAAGMMAELANTEEYNEDYLLEAADFYQRAANYEKALEYLDKVMNTSSGDEDILMEKMHIYLKMNNVDKAAEIIEGLIKQNTQDGEYYKLLGEIYDNNKQPEKAKEVYDRALKVIPDDPSVLMGLADHYGKLNDTVNYDRYLKKAIINNNLDAEEQIHLLITYAQNIRNDSASRKEELSLVNQLQKLHPDDAKILALYADFLSFNNLRDSAITEYKKSLAIDQSTFEVWKNFLENFVAKNEPDSLIKYSEKAIRLFPNNAIAHYYNGIGHKDHKDYPVAIKAINRAIDLMPDNEAQDLSEMHATLGEIYSATKQYDNAASEYKKSLALDRSRVEVWVVLLETFLANNQPDSVVIYSERALRLFPNEAIIYYYNGIGYRGQKNYTDAVNAINQAISLFAKNDTENLSDMYATLGDIYNTAKKYDLSDSSFNKALRLFPNNTSSLNNYSYFLSVRGVKLDKAEKMSEKSLQLKPDEPTFLDTYGWILYQKSDYEKAREYIEKAVQLSGQNIDATLYDHLGNIYYKLQNKDKAVEYWKKAKEKGSDDPQLDKKIREGKLYE